MGTLVGAILGVGLSWVNFSWLGLRRRGRGLGLLRHSGGRLRSRQCASRTEVGGSTGGRNHSLGCLSRSRAWITWRRLGCDHLWRSHASSRSRTLTVRHARRLVRNRRQPLSQNIGGPHSAHVCRLSLPLLSLDYH